MRWVFKNNPASSQPSLHAVYGVGCHTRQIRPFPPKLQRRSAQKIFKPQKNAKVRLVEPPGRRRHGKPSVAERRTQPPQGSGFEKLHVLGTEATFLNRTQGARRQFAERPVCFCRPALDSQDKLLRHAAHDYIVYGMIKGTSFFSVLGFGEQWNRKPA